VGKRGVRAHLIYDSHPDKPSVFGIAVAVVVVV